MRTSYRSAFKVTLARSPEFFGVTQQYFTCTKEHLVAEFLGNLAVTNIPHIAAYNFGGIRARNLSKTMVIRNGPPDRLIYACRLEILEFLLGYKHLPFVFLLTYIGTLVMHWNCVLQHSTCLSLRSTESCHESS